MKKLLLIIVLLTLGVTLNAQKGKFNVAANIALPIGDSSNAFSFGFSAEANYLFEISDDFQVGPSASLIYYFGKSENGFEVEDASFLPLAAAGRFNISDEFTLGADLGYGIGISPDGINSGFYYRPMIGYNVSENMMLQASYSGISVDGFTFANISIGVMFEL